MSAGGALSRPAPGLAATQQAAQDKIQIQIRHGHGCPACQAELVPGAIFCVECGHALGCPCPQCGAEVGGCDFCEACGHWLKPGQCRFCYAQTPEGAAFCTECGTSQQGLRCARCQTVGFFDFCSGCGGALSDLAQDLAQAPPDDPALAEALQQLRQLDAAAQQASAPPTLLPPQARPVPPPPPGLNLSGALQSMRAFSAQDAAAAERARQQAVLDRQAAQARAAAASAQADQAAREQVLQAARQSEMAQSEASALVLSLQRQQARERIMALVAGAAQRTFADAQTARRHVMQLRECLIVEGQRPTQWLCNWANCKHDTPNDCGNPTLGGRWLFD